MRTRAEDRTWAREALAGDPAMPAGLLEVLAHDPDPRVREAAAENGSTPATTIEALAGDASARVRAAARAHLLETCGMARTRLGVSREE